MDTSATTDTLVGRLLDGRYRVEARIARGGMATVYEATDLRLDRKVALKVVPYTLSDDVDFTDRFVREARAAARLAHPNVVGVFDQGEDGGVLFLAMEYVQGRHTLRDVIRDEAPLSPGRALAIVEEILTALAAAHESGIIHRDVKPENVLIGRRGQIKVADFGLARAISSATSATATGGVLMGTVSYLPPELVTEGTADARSDVYSLGVMLFEMLTGTKPHAGDTPIQVAYKHVHEDIPPPSSLVPGIPSYVDALVARATSRHRDLRPADAHVMLQQLRRVRHALDRGVLDDQELTDDLTPTVTIGAMPYDVPVVGETGLRDRVDEVFDQEAYADAPVREHTLVVGDPVAVEPSSEATFPAVAATYGSGPPPPAQPPRRRRRKAGWIALLLVLLLAAAAAVAGWYVAVGRFQTTPDIVSMSERAASAKVAAAGLTLVVSGTAYSETVATGHVVSTSPGPGDRVVKHGTVRAVISRGPERHGVPKLDGLTESDAITAITHNHLRVGHVTRVWNDHVSRGVVMRATPKAGTLLRRDAPVAMVISRGPAPIRIKDYTGKSGDDAQSELSDKGFHVVVRQRFDDNVADGLVIAQRPDTGIGHRGDRMLLVVSKGPHLVDVPDVVRSGIDAARQTLTDAGFKVEVRQYTPYLGWGIVAGQSPNDGRAPYGSTVVIYVL